MQDKGHPEMIETTLDRRLPTDIFLKAETEHRHRCQPAVTVGLEKREVGRERVNDFCPD
jgi:hypothetical protein